MLLVKEISTIEVPNFNFQGFTANRKVASFGFDYSFDNRSLTKGKDIPSLFNFVKERVSEHLSIAPNEIAELLITEYPAGSVINWRRDSWHVLF